MLERVWQARPRLIPVRIVCGPLGAGKTSLVNEMLRHSPERRVGVVENEYGEVSIDDALLASSTMVRSVQGCACCGSGRRALCVTLAKLAMEDEPPESVVIELSGVCEPGPVAKSIVVEPALRRFYRLYSVVAVVDARTFPELSPACVRVADAVVVNKVDLVDKEKLRRVEAAVKCLALCRCRILRAEHGRGYKPSRKSTFSPARAIKADPGFFRYNFSDESRRPVESLALMANDLTRDQISLIQGAVEDCLGPEDGVERYKGAFSLRDDERHVVIQGVKSYSREARFDDKRRWTRSESRLVFLGAHLNKAKIVDVLCRDQFHFRPVLAA